MVSWTKICFKWRGPSWDKGLFAELHKLYYTESTRKLEKHWFKYTDLKGDNLENKRSVKTLFFLGHKLFEHPSCICPVFLLTHQFEADFFQQQIQSSFKFTFDNGISNLLLPPPHGLDYQIDTGEKHSLFWCSLILNWYLESGWKINYQWRV